MGSVAELRAVDEEPEFSHMQGQQSRIFLDHVIFLQTLCGMIFNWFQENLHRLGDTLLLLTRIIYQRDALEAADVLFGY